MLEKGKWLEINKMNIQLKNQKKRATKKNPTKKRAEENDNDRTDISAA